VRHLALLPLLFALVLTGCPGGQAGTQPAKPAPAAVASAEVYQVELETTKGKVVIEVHPEWAPLGEARFRELVESGYFNGCSFFRVVEGFVVQFGISGDPALTKKWKDNTFNDEPVVGTNARGTLTFAKTNSPNSRTTQLFINLADNPRLDGMGFSPFAKVVSGMEIVDSFYAGYGEGAPRGNGPDQQLLNSQGDAYVKANFPKLDKIITAKVVSASK
jgi:cyclophilin family peptidyl-prolyl cis-trans isomerase